ncbi:MAG TPA: hypothetical protein VLL25_07620 [Acidimicrobiales bacterium]|nr:hypothetical protein [Acidimicrobiales bacterium]
MCVYTARPAVICIAGRIEPGPGLEILEGLVADAVVRLRQRWPIERIEIPSASDFAGITYLTARVIVRATITL